MPQRNALRSGAGLGGTGDPQLLTAMAAEAGSTVPDGPVAECDRQCDDTPTPLPDDIGRMCSGQGGPYAGTEGAEPGCEYYRWRHNDFVKRHQGCKPPIPDPPPYYLEYGEKYCNRFSRETKEQLSPEGQIWLDKTRCALQRGIEDELNREPKIEMNSADFKEMAFSTHPDAYVESGLAHLPSKDLGRILLTVDAEEWLNGATWEQAGETARRILPIHLGTVMGDTVYDNF